VSATADDLKKWLKAINSDDEKVWKPALAELEYHDPRTALTTAEQLELVDTDAGRKRLFLLWMPYTLGRPEYIERMTLKQNGANVKCEWRVGDSWQSTEFNPHDYLDTDRAVWQRAALAAHVLHRADTKASRPALARLAGGHEKSGPTRTAAELLKAEVPKPVAEFTDKLWDWLLSGSPSEVVAAVFALRETKNVTGVLKAKLPAIKATKEQLTKWVKALDGDERGAAFHKLCYFHPSLALTLSEQCDLVSTDRGRGTLFQFWWQDYGRPAGWITFANKLQLTPADDQLVMSWPRRDPPPPLVAPVPPLEKQTCAQWQRARLAIVVLEKIGTAEAKEVLKQLADGHPDILPTKEAKAALGRLK
jgi:hypothetical protein